MVELVSNCTSLYPLTMQSILLPKIPILILQPTKGSGLNWLSRDFLWCCRLVSSVTVEGVGGLGPIVRTSPFRVSPL